jgi:IS1 family transposase/transposase-like protein
MKCNYCQNACYKRGKRNGVQQYSYKTCKKYQQAAYTKPRIPQEKHDWTVKLNNEGCGISNIARLLQISKSSVQRVIERVVANLQMSEINETGQSYEIDELRTFCRNKRKELWLIYAINRSSKRIINFVVGRRTKENIAMVVSTLQKLNPKAIYSDRLNIYRSLINKNIHKVHLRCINYIERKNLTLRTHLKRLARKTICFTRSENMLYNVMYIWMSKQ